MSKQNFSDLSYYMHLSLDYRVCCSWPAQRFSIKESGLKSSNLPFIGKPLLPVFALNKVYSEMLGSSLLFTSTNACETQCHLWVKSISYEKNILRKCEKCIYISVFCLCLWNIVQCFFSLLPTCPLKHSCISSQSQIVICITQKMKQTKMYAESLATYSDWGLYYQD